ncbi:YhcH/YjgK/YiaL family protein [Vibrio hannami]|uniref:YhcH/YjgK/YiaL family protein n=1 Tax=Vibrio hannami TaxID=2717094 RepID=UPI002410000F|nr:YhcH/YjgK/YiaL family protein [Vibrio hannami]MDG3085113.1 YhcH/YjgK/YiaL family protein [Vibrio hannami]
MLFGNITQLDLLPYTYTMLRNVIDEAVAIAERNPDGVYSLSDERIFVNLISALTEHSSQRAAEIHKKYIDVQVLLEGCERIGYSNVLEEDIQIIDQVENDLLIIEDVVNENFVDLKSGDFVLYFPNQVHRPLCAVDSTGRVRKAIIKIPADIFV